MKFHREIMLISFILLPMIAGCGATGGNKNTDVSASKVSRASDLAGCDGNGASAHLDVALIRKLMEEERYHAAMAQIDALPKETSYTRYVRARILHKLAMPEAETQYRELFGSCMDGYARHGLGLLMAETGNMEQAVEYLGAARQQFPLDAVIRNDYGYALLLSGDPDAAYFEFITALEMESSALQPRYNALVVLLLLEREIQAQRFAERMNISDQYIVRARQEAAVLKTGQAEMMSEQQRMSGYRPSRNSEQAGPAADNALFLQLETGITPAEHSR